MGSVQLHERLEKRHADKPLSRGHEKRRRLRETQLNEKGYVPRPKVVDQHVRSAAVIESPVDFSNFLATNGAYSAKLSRTASPSKEYNVAELVNDGFELIQWDG